MLISPTNIHPDLQELIIDDPNFKSVILSLNDFIELTTELSGDIHQCAIKLEEDKTDQFWRRMALKNLISTIEGFIYTSKKLALQFSYFSKVNLSQAEIALLNETNFRLKDNGDVKIDDSKLRTKANLLFALKMCSKAVVAPPIEFDKTKDTWLALLQSIEIRHRITHPKNKHSLFITDEEFKLIELAADWYMEVISTIVDYFLDYIGVRAEELKNKKNSDSS
jgi:hypothetical protein